MKWLMLAATIGLCGYLVGGDIIADATTAEGPGCGTSSLAASTFAKQAVRDALKAPDTADFHDVTAHKDGECVYMVAGKVTAQNGFGAALTHDFSVGIIFSEGGGWTHTEAIVTPG